MKVINAFVAGCSATYKDVITDEAGTTETVLNQLRLSINRPIDGLVDTKDGRVVTTVYSCFVFPDVFFDASKAAMSARIEKLSEKHATAIKTLDDAYERAIESLDVTKINDAQCIREIVDARFASDMESAKASILRDKDVDALCAGIIGSKVDITSIFVAEGDCFPGTDTISKKDIFVYIIDRVQMPDGFTFVRPDKTRKSIVKADKTPIDGVPPVEGDKTPIDGVPPVEGE